MGAGLLDSRDVIGSFFQRLEQQIGTEWLDDVSMLFQSDSASEKYAWLGMSPIMRQWIGARQAKSFRENSITIENLDFEATLEILVKELRRDKTGQMLVRINDLADRTNAHWAQLLSTLINNGETELAYDDKALYATDHEDGESGAQSNLISYNVVSPTAPTAAELELGILTNISNMLAFVDDVGEPLNDGAKNFTFMTGTGLMAPLSAALKNPTIVDGSGSRNNTVVNTMGSFGLKQVVNSRITAQDAIYMFRTDANTKALIRQEEQPVSLDVIAEGSELEFRLNRHQYGVKASRNVGTGFWQNTLKIQLT